MSNNALISKLTCLYSFSKHLAHMYLTSLLTSYIRPSWTLLFSVPCPRALPEQPWAVMEATEVQKLWLLLPLVDWNEETHCSIWDLVIWAAASVTGHSPEPSRENEGVLLNRSWSTWNIKCQICTDSSLTLTYLLQYSHLERSCKAS